MCLDNILDWVIFSVCIDCTKPLPFSFCLVVCVRCQLIYAWSFCLRPNIFLLFLQMMMNEMFPGHYFAKHTLNLFPPVFVGLIWYSLLVVWEVNFLLLKWYTWMETAGSCKDCMIYFCFIFLWTSNVENLKIFALFFYSPFSFEWIEGLHSWITCIKFCQFSKFLYYCLFLNNLY